MRGPFRFFSQWMVHTRIVCCTLMLQEESRVSKTIKAIKKENGLENKRLLFILTRNKKIYFFQLP